MNEPLDLLEFGTNVLAKTGLTFEHVLKDLMEPLCHASVLVEVSDDVSKIVSSFRAALNV